MGAPVRVPQFQDPQAFPSLAVPKRGWRRSGAAEHSLDAEGRAARVFVCRVDGFRVTITEAVDGRLTGTLSDTDRMWMLSDHSTLVAWMAAMQCLRH